MNNREVLWIAEKNWNLYLAYRQKGFTDSQSVLLTQSHGLKLSDVIDNTRSGLDPAKD